ncbi:tRNA uridine(34) 5-carboxymethylaminomethyl modification radical SAM/GNAT enzyme Elp3 [Candidatus Woesearchaeota archaeon]|nr:tRNA uridine(34) 5-carboxymethylaminomethyl modification radical SAM/GNAT enzyme Elp3 [Candidatus Woesearchaeota archaeon]
MGYYEAVLDWIKEERPSKEALAKKKVLLCKEHGTKRIPTDIEILLHADKEDLETVKPYLKTKPVRAASGVAVVATMTKPIACPHGTCTYCPGGPSSAFGDTPKSYTGKEPSTMRGARHGYDPYRIIFNRLEQYLAMGQHPDKAEQIVMGGTFTAFPKDYQEEYIKGSFKAYNDFSEYFFKEGKLDLERFKEFFELPGKKDDEERAARITKRTLLMKRKGERSLREEQERNEKAAIRCVGLTIETRPDMAGKEQGIELLRLGATRIELGVQTTHDDVLQAVHRGHTTEDTKKSMADLRDLGFKLNAHMMPGLPGPDGNRISKERDLASLREVFKNPSYKPDMLKIYPCLVMPGTALEQEYERGVFKPLSAAEAADIIVEAKRHIPEWCRIMRIQRDIPTNITTAGVEHTNLRQDVTELAEQRGVRCRCIRCREIGLGTYKNDPELVVRSYEASGGEEHFISAEADDKVLGFVRLRLPPRCLHPAITPTTALIRELHVYGKAAPIGGQGEVQHRGLGKQLMAAAEALAKKRGKSKVVVISGVGVREYYRRLGYRQEGPYMTKQL